MLPLSNTVALVTGGGSGLGAAAASALLQRGARVLVADLAASGETRDTLAQLWAKNLGVKVVDDSSQGSVSSAEEGPAVCFFEADVCDPFQVSAALDTVERCFGEPLTCAINCAGIALARKTLSKKGVHPLGEFQKVLTVNTVGTFNVACLAAKRMSQRDADEDGMRGCIVNTASIAAFEGQIGQVAYAASKAGILGMTLPMARDLAPYGIRVMTIVSTIQKFNSIIYLFRAYLTLVLNLFLCSRAYRHRGFLPRHYSMVFQKKSSKNLVPLCLVRAGSGSLKSLVNWW